MSISRHVISPRVLRPRQQRSEFFLLFSIHYSAIFAQREGGGSRASMLLQGAYRSFANGEEVGVLLSVLQKRRTESPDALEINLNFSVVVVTTNGLRRSIDFVQTARGCVYSTVTNSPGRLDARARAASSSVSQSLCHQVSLTHGRCHDAATATNATAKVSAQQHAQQRKRQSRRKPLRSKTQAHSLAASRLLLASAFHRSCKHKKPFPCAATNPSHKPAAGGTTSGSRPRGAAATTTSEKGETPLDSLRHCVRLTSLMMMGVRT